MCSANFGWPKHVKASLSLLDCIQGVTSLLSACMTNMMHWHHKTLSDKGMRHAPHAEAISDLAALAPLIEQHGPPTSLLAKGFRNMFNSLARSILGQQLAVKAAKVISGRFMTLCQASCRASVDNMQKQVFPFSPCKPSHQCTLIVLP